MNDAPDGQRPADPASADPKGLIRESYAIDAISAAQCRSILVDWALSLPEGVTQSAGLQQMLAVYGDAHPDHPMTALLREGLHAPLTSPGRRGGRAGRFSA
ncbi:hypothetical protein [Roseicitreum antarcticum]|uniref:Uncharacterized protein n=1 Tax=Roseicitreum antarcticum TaxID=564137 RepID=A0A1H3C7R1_9RHOB|nr:hypothetical protein [Roseicitreum antarcticum]SDX50173.1 hypothetical protein SAMN04488238_10959 [Roseicitreum antarcticum]